MSRCYIIATVLLSVFLMLSSLLAASDSPRLPDADGENFVCISGEIYDTSTGKPLAGVGICVFPEGMAADSSASPGSIHENGTEYPLPHIPRLHWIRSTDTDGRFAICEIPAWLGDKTFGAIIYKPGYIPQFPDVLAVEGPDPFYGTAISLVPSDS